MDVPYKVKSGHATSFAFNKLEVREREIVARESTTICKM